MYNDRQTQMDIHSENHVTTYKQSFRQIYRLKQTNTDDKHTKKNIPPKRIKDMITKIFLKLLGIQKVV